MTPTLVLRVSIDCTSVHANSQQRPRTIGWGKSPRRTAMCTAERDRYRRRSASSAVVRSSVVVSASVAAILRNECHIGKFMATHVHEISSRPHSVRHCCTPIGVGLRAEAYALRLYRSFSCEMTSRVLDRVPR